MFDQEVEHLFGFILFHTRQLAHELKILQQEKREALYLIGG